MKNIKYPDLFNLEIKVKFKVISVPFFIDVNGFELTMGQTGLESTIYNVYSKGSYGTRFKVNT